MSGLANQRVLVIGGGSGIGSGVARAAAEQGASVVIAGRSLERLRAQAGELGAGAAAVDVTSEESVRALFEQVGDIDHVVYTARPGGGGGPVREASLEAAQAVLATKLLGALLVAKHARLRPGGSLTFTSGVVAWKPKRGAAVMAAANAGLAALVQTLALELAPLRVNAVSPGIIETPAWDGLPDRAAFFERTAAGLPAGRVGQPADLAQAYLYLMANGFVTGQLLHVDGGAQLGA